MADNVTIPATGSGTATPVIATDDIAGVHHQAVLLEWGPDGTANRTDTASGKSLPVQLRGSDGTDYSSLLPTKGSATVVTTSVTRPADTTAYTANDAMSDSTSAPAAITFSSVARASGGTLFITGLEVISSANKATALQGELWLFDTAPTAINDNAAFTITDAEYETKVAKIPFVLDSPGNSAADASGNTGCSVDGLSILTKCVSSANLTALIKVINAYTPVSAEKITFRLKVLRID